MAVAQQKWDWDTLTAQIVGELNQDRSAAGGTVPDRLGTIVHESYEELWEEHDWLFKRVTATLALTAATATADMPDTFEKLDPKWLHENNDRGPLYFTDEAHPFEDQRYNDKDITGDPIIARIQPKTSEVTKYVWQVEVTPTPAAGMTYRYVYLRYAPPIDGATVILWPQPFHRGWHLLALARCQRSFKPDESWQETFAAYMHLLTRLKRQNDETMRSSTPYIYDGNGYLGDVASSGCTLD